MPWRNRVTPFGQIISVAERGTLMGNRGVLINAERRLVRDSQARRWIACALDFRGRRRTVMTPRRWTELFFLDEATALAAGHRPCAECRHADYKRFQQAWRTALLAAAPTADAMDRALHRERRLGPWIKRTYKARIGDLPQGVMVARHGRAWLLHGAAVVEWTPAGYTTRHPAVLGAEVEVLTPPSVVAVLRAGYPVGVHSTAAAG